MGLKKAELLYNTLRDMRPRAFVDVMTRAEQDDFKRSKRGKTKAGGLYQLRTSFQCSADVAAIDLPTQDRSVMAHRTHCHQMTRSLSKKLDAAVRRTGARYLVVCIDNRRYVPPAKQREQAKRRANDYKPYEDDLILADGSFVGDPNDYEFADEFSVPGDYRRMARTPILMSRFYSYLVDFLFNHYVPEDQRITLIISGACHPETGEEQTLYVRYPSGGPVERATAPPVLIGEAECAAVYWLLRLMAKHKDVRNGFVQTVDSDGCIALLLNMPRFLELSKDASIWLDYSTPQTHQRFVNTTDAWRGIMLWTRDNVPRPRHQHDPVGALVVSLLIGGCDYVDPISNHGPTYALKTYLDQPGLLAGSRRSRPSATVVGVAREAFSPSMFISENKLFDLIWNALRSHSAFASMLKQYGEDRLRRMTIVGRFDTCARQVQVYNKTVAALREKAAEHNKKIPKGVRKGRKSAPSLAPAAPNFEEMRALVRRVLWTVDYFRNCPLGAYIPRSEAFEVNGVSVCGFAIDDWDEPKPTCIEAPAVAPATTLPQPFVNRLKRSIGKRKRAPGDALREHKEKKRRTETSRRIGRSSLILSQSELDEMADLVVDPFGSFIRNSDGFSALCRQYAHLRESPAHKMK